MPCHASDITLAVANSTCNTIQAVGTRYTETHPVNIHYLCKSSGRLAKGIRGGAIQADIYISANRHWMDYMIDGGLVNPDKVVSPWSNSLVVSAPADSPLQLQTWEGLSTQNIETILIGDPGTAPFGRYAKQALQKTGLWERVRQKITTKKHITMLAETLAESDDHTVGILFSTNLTERLRPLFAIDPSWHPPIQYYMGLVGQAADNPVVSEFFDYVRSDTGLDMFKTAGFIVMPE
ncbi:molybdate ABC transporter substrate-binding protein [Sedimenticola sp.]|uniref:molybdate ABC transporter substrate-binding protein n=1 Tax=Sedimenticola sp. TaxID=1940285 RepID=UPI003D0BA54B